MSWGITKQIDCFSPVGWNEETIPYWDEATNSKLSLNAPLGSSVYNERWNDFLSAFKVHLDGKGWFDKAVLYLDEVSEAKLNDVVSMVHGNDKSWKLGIAYSHGLSNSSKANFYDMSGILEDASNDGIAGDKISTFYTSCTQTRPNNYVTPDNSTAEMTWMAWHAFNEGFDGYLRWAFDYWRLWDPFDARDGGHTAGDFSMVYRASNNAPSEVLSSIRFEMLREGIQDFEKLRILKATLETSSDPKDVEVLNGLLLIISKFGKASGVEAQQLIIEGQDAIASITDTSFTIANDNFSTDNVDETFIYPNPTDGIVNVVIQDTTLKKVPITLFDLQRKLVAEGNYEIENGDIPISLVGLPIGMYLLRLGLKTPRSFKIIKK